MSYPIDHSLIDVVPANLNRDAAKSYLAKVRSCCEERAIIFLTRAHLLDSDLTSKPVWDTIASFAAENFKTEPISQEEARRRLADANEQMGPLRKIISFEDILRATGGSIDEGDPTDESRQIGFDISCLETSLLLKHRTGLRWALTRTKRLDHPYFQQPCLTGFYMHLSSCRCATLQGRVAGLQEGKPAIRCGSYFRTGCQRRLKRPIQRSDLFFPLSAYHLPCPARPPVMYELPRPAEVGGVSVSG